MRRTTHNGLFLAIAVVTVMLTAACGGPKHDQPDSTPSAPAVAADSITVLPTNGPVEQLPGMTVVTGHDGELVGPHSRIEVDAVGRFSALSATDAVGLGLDTAGMSAPAGHQLLLAYIGDIAPDQGLAISRADPSMPSLAVKVGDQVRDLPEPLRRTDIVIVAVPTGGDADLQLTDTGRTQSVSLATGRRGPDAVTLYYSVHPQHVAANADTNFMWEQLPVSTNVTIAVDLTLSPYTATDGWLPAGTADLTLGIGTSVFDANQMSLPTLQGLTASGGTVDLGRSLTVTLANGTAVKLSGSDDAGPQYVGEVGDPGPDRTFHFRVPATTTWLTLTFKPTGTIRYQDGKSVRHSPMIHSAKTTVRVDFTSLDSLP
jgi:hypothetical protein